MSEELAEVSPGNDNEEIVEDYIIEELDESIYTVDIKEEHDPQSDDLEDDDAQIVCLGKDKSTGEDVYHCALCNLTFDSIEQHLKTNHNVTDVEQYDESIQMLVEEEGEGEEESMVLHELNEQDLTEIEPSNPIKIETTDIVCKDCDNIYESMQDAESHECNGFNLNRALCSNCQAVFDSEEDMETHQCTVTTVKEEPIDCVFSCLDCPKEFCSLITLQKHQKSHKSRSSQMKKKNASEIDITTESETNHCDICNTTFSSSKNLKLHAKMHLTVPKKTIKEAMPIGTDEFNTKNQFYCEICNKSFDHGLLSVHQNMHQNVEEHNCSICNRQFENQISYDMHMQLHADQPPRVRKPIVAKPGARFTCNYCGRGFLRPHEKVKHERIHTGEKPHECEVCGKCFRVSYSLTLHLRTHTDVRPFVCTQCNKRFKAYAVYSHHLNTHSEERPFKCPMCPKSFRTSVQLCGHKNSHTKPYNCPECNRPFASLYAVKMHMKTHNKANKSNENLKHRCGICGAVYARMFALRFHMKEQHSADLADEHEKDLNEKQLPITADDCFNEDEVSTQAIMQGEEIIIDNFHTEEIVTDWLTQK